MAEVFTTQLFKNELPDYAQHLTEQIPLPEPRKFACFADLTIEIRLDIWNLTFPGKREIELKPHKFKRRPNRTKCTCLPKACTHHPVALFINHESRAETLIHYRCLLRDKMYGGKRNGAQRIYFRPSRDVLYVDLRSIRNLVPYDWATTFHLHNESLFSNLKRLEISDWDWDERVREAFLKREIKLLEHFPALQEVTVTLTNYFGLNFENQYQVVDQLKLPVARESEAALKEHFDWLAEMDPRKKVPRIKMRTFKQTLVYEC